MPVLLVEDLRKSLNNKAPVVRGVSFNVDAGEIYAFLGPNGAGKTTTIKMIAGLLVPETGVVRIDGMDPHAGSAAMSRIGTVLEGNRNLYWRMTSFENLRYFDEGYTNGTLTQTEEEARALVSKIMKDRYRALNGGRSATWLLPETARPEMYTTRELHINELRRGGATRDSPARRRCGWIGSRSEGRVPSDGRGR